MQFKHNNGALTNQKDREHQGGIQESMCWCLPVRTRFNGLTQEYEVWDRDKFEWAYDTDANQSDEYQEVDEDSGQRRTPT